MRALIVCCLLLCAGCSQTSMLTREDYQTSQGEFLRGDDENALLDFPRGAEDGDFITTVERGYLSLIQGKPQIAPLQRQEKLQRRLRLFDERIDYHLSRQTRTLFDARVPLDYQPAAYERVWLHLLLGWGYADQGKYTDAAAEARIARDLLAPASIPGATISGAHFDDPMLRLFLAGLWTMCGQWREAQLDLRAASALDGSLGWAKELAARERAPAQLFVVMGGPGPDVVWDPEMGINLLRSARAVKFVLRGRKSALSVEGAHGMSINAHLSPDARQWYASHPAREGEPTDILQDMAYGGKATAGSIEATGIFAGNTGGYVVTGVVGGAVAGPVLILIEGASHGAPNGGAAGSGTTTSASAGTISGSTTSSMRDLRDSAAIFAAVGGVIGLGMGAVEGYEKAAEQFKTTMDPIPRYRYVRYLPEYLWVAWTDQPVAYPVKLRTPLQVANISAPTVVNGTAVTVAHLVDTYESMCRYSIDHGTTTILAPPDASGSCPVHPDAQD